ncbi:hypothetical protein NKR23_g12198 [Pleurostoma richardsiae]|uniref:BZIP domain-containing protein n=1 Tax=Pleurostoma richardsiae TaxID=41990 RepID=A0AA38VGC0_9PEZI|nr:hypothetical protein NKR23_g12198 [Pleurostoma richardsiae]
MLQRWSSKPKEHRAARIRDNQRRHRARIKAYIAHLERQLEGAREHVHELEARNTTLLSELERLRASCANEFLTRNYPAEEEDAYSQKTIAVAACIAPPAANLGTTQGTERSSSSPPPTWAEPSVGKDKRKSLPSCSCGAPSCPAPAILATVAAPKDDAEENLLHADCSRLPPPSVRESTIPCDTAYGILREQNDCGLDWGVIGEFLAPGFRRATGQHDGCLVQSHRVFSVLDAIGSSMPSILSNDP